MFNDMPFGDARGFQEELGFYSDIEWHDIRSFAKLVFPGLEVRVPSGDPQAYRAELLGHFPAEVHGLDRYFRDLSALNGLFGAMHQGRRGRRDLLAGLRGAMALLPKVKMSFSDYLASLTSDEKLRRVLAAFYGYGGLPPQSASALSMLFLSAAVLLQPLRYPKQGYQAIPDFLAEKLLEFGGKIRYGERVSRLDVRDGQVESVISETGAVYRANAVLSNADTATTFVEMVSRENLSRRTEEALAVHTPSSSCLSIHVGTSLDLARRTPPTGRSSSPRAGSLRRTSADA